MKTNITSTVVLLAMLMASGSPAQSRSDSFDALTTSVSEIILNPLPDGGCAARWTGSNVSADGGSTLTATTNSLELTATVQQNRCDGLRTAGIARVNKALRLDPDGGTP